MIYQSTAIRDHRRFVQGVLDLLALQQQFFQLIGDGDLDGSERFAAEIGALYEAIDRDLSPAFRDIVEAFFDSGE